MLDASAFLVVPNLSLLQSVRPCPPSEASPFLLRNFRFPDLYFFALIVLYSGKVQPRLVTKTLGRSDWAFSPTSVSSLSSLDQYSDYL